MFMESSRNVAKSTAAAGTERVAQIAPRQAKRDGCISRPQSFELNQRIEAKLRAISRLVKSRQKGMAQTPQTGNTQMPQKGAAKNPIAA
jgi:hypothetical protein